MVQLKSNVKQLVVTKNNIVANDELLVVVVMDGG
jgi:hypothetical protein